jgi:hypothetical protein
VLFTKGPEYTNKILNKAATCIQKWVKGWLIRKEINKLKDMVFLKISKKNQIFSTKNFKLQIKKGNE